MPQFCRFFLSNDFAADLNVDNPLGYKGRLAEAYADLLNEYFHGGRDVYNIASFKDVLASVASQFADREQVCGCPCLVSVFDFD